MNAAQISTQLSPLNLLSLLKSSLKQFSLHETTPAILSLKQTRSQFESTYLSENLSDLFRKQLL